MSSIGTATTPSATTGEHKQESKGQKRDGLTAEERAQFQSQKVMALKVPIKIIGKVVKHLKDSKYTLDMPKQKTVVERPGDSECKLVLLNPKFFTSTDLSLAPPSFADNLLPLGVSSPALTEHQLAGDAALPKTEDILRRLLPASVTVPTAFETVGHIAHYNLRDEQWPYRHVIGRATIEKNPNIRTVITKVGTITNEFRVFDMEVIAGDKEFVTTVKQDGHVFNLDYSKVYWNSRLSTEHERLVALFKPGDVIYDMFCGIGPFAIPAAKAGCLVFANDLNPESTKWLDKNLRSQGTKFNYLPDYVLVSNDDARAFIRRRAAEAVEGKAPWADHIVMNLPMLAPEFLDVFCGLLHDVPINVVRGQSDKESKESEDEKAGLKPFGSRRVYLAKEKTWANRPLGNYLQGSSHAALPMIHCYCFASKAGEEGKAEALTRVRGVLGYEVEGSVFCVRDIAPGKSMMCVSFRMPLQVLQRRPSAASQASESVASTQPSEADASSGLKRKPEEPSDADDGASKKPRESSE